MLRGCRFCLRAGDEEFFVEEEAEAGGEDAGGGVIEAGLRHDCPAMAEATEAAAAALMAILRRGQVSMPADGVLPIRTLRCHAGILVSLCW